jgi:hypothetical protein
MTGLIAVKSPVGKLRGHQGLFDATVCEKGDYLGEGKPTS